MSFTAARQSKRIRRSCQSCRARKARFRYRGRVSADRDHTLCFECFRSERERRRAQALTEVASPPPLRSPFLEAAALTGAQVAHRRRMLAHLNAGRTT